MNNSATFFNKGKTEIVVKVLEVQEGEPIKVTALTPQNYQIECTIDNKDEKLAKYIANKLFDWVKLIGIAKWYLETNKIEYFEILDVVEYNFTKINTAIRELKEIIGDDFNDIDALKYVSDERNYNEKENNDE